MAHQKDSSSDANPARLYICSTFLLLPSTCTAQPSPGRALHCPDVSGFGFNSVVLHFTLLPIVGDLPALPCVQTGLHTESVSSNVPHMFVLHPALFSFTDLGHIPRQGLGCQTMNESMNGCSNTCIQTRAKKLEWLQYTTCCFLLSGTVEPMPPSAPPPKKKRSKTMVWSQKGNETYGIPTTHQHEWDLG